jgi:hypothetical protein
VETRRYDSEPEPPRRAGTFAAGAQANGTDQNTAQVPAFRQRNRAAVASATARRRVGRVASDGQVLISPNWLSSRARTGARALRREHRLARFRLDLRAKIKLTRRGIRGAWSKATAGLTRSLLRLGRGWRPTRACCKSKESAACFQRSATVNDASRRCWGQGAAQECARRAASTNRATESQQQNLCGRFWKKPIVMCGGRLAEAPLVGILAVG